MCQPSLRRDRGYVNAPLLHFGYIERADRIRKLGWYFRSIHPDNKTEGNYSHICRRAMYRKIPADAKLLHAGPLKLAPLALK